MSDEQQLWRAQHYALLATLLVAPPQQNLLDNIVAIDVTEPDSPMGKAWHQLIDAAQKADIEALQHEYHSLFIGLTQGELVPYGSYYQTGFLNEKPLAKLRADLSLLGLERQQDKREPEDHIAAECDVMRLILSAQGTPVINAETFFAVHLQPWVAKFFTDLAKADSADFYRAVAEFGQQFIELESRLIK